MNTPQPPQPPDPVATANAQAGMNRQTAITQGELNSTNQVTPYGNLTYTKSGAFEDGTPQFTATTSLSPDQQQLLSLGTQTQKTLGQIGVDQSSKVANILNTPFDLNKSIGTHQADISKTLLDPVWTQREDALRTRLANQGITEGSPAFTNAIRDFGMERDNSYNSALLADRGQASTEALTERNQPLNEITALMSGSSVHQPTFTNTPSESIAPPNYEGDVANNFSGQMQGYNAQLQNQNAMMGGLFGLGGSLGSAGMMSGWGSAAPRMMMLSDRDAKTDIARVGTLDNGLPVYVYRYKDGGNYQIGVMADEVESIKPHAVAVIDGLKHVDYAEAVRA